MWSVCLFFVGRGGGLRGEGGWLSINTTTEASFIWMSGMRLRLGPCRRPSAHLNASWVSRRAACPWKGVGPSPFKTKRITIFGGAPFSQTAVINENGRQRNWLTMTAVAWVCLWCPAPVVSASETGVCLLKLRALHKNCAGSRLEKFHNRMGQQTSLTQRPLPHHFTV